MRTAIKDYRNKLNISQKVLAQKAGVDQSYISKLENGEIRHVSFMVIERIAKVLEVCPLILISGCSISKSGYCYNCKYYKDRFVDYNMLPEEAQKEFIKFIKYLTKKYNLFL